MKFISDKRIPQIGAWVAFTIGLCSPTVHADDAASSCKPVKYDRGSIAIEVLVKGEGKQCLVQDLKQRSAIDLIDGRQRGAPTRIVDFFEASNVDLDLQGHMVTSEPFNNATGVALSSDRPLFDSEATRELLAQAVKTGGVNVIKEGMRISHDLSVRNGVIRTPGPRGVGVYLGFYKGYELAVNYYSRAFARLPEDDRPMSRQVNKEIPYVRDPHKCVTQGCRFEPTTRNVITFVDPWNYQPETRFTLDSLNIKSGGRGVIMTGAKNVLRNSTIEVDSDTAVYLYGPGSVVEGNTFIIHQAPDYPYPAALPAALKLRDADGAVIRNNRFIVKGGLFGMFKGQADVAINLLESRNVTIENNTVEGAKSLVRKDSMSTFAEQGNMLK